MKQGERYSHGGMGRKRNHGSFKAYEDSEHSKLALRTNLYSEHPDSSGFLFSFLAQYHAFIGVNYILEKF